MPPKPHLDISLFRGQTHLQIPFGHFQQNVNTNENNSEPGLDLLRQKASLSAAHDASARDPSPRCAPGTREKVIAEIIQWIADPSSNTSVLWLNGPFGNGKSAMMQTIAERLRTSGQLSRLFAGSFFFGRGKAGRDKAKYLVPTIAYQLAVTIRPMREPIDRVVSQDPTIFSKTIDVQLRDLITNPLHEVTRDLSGDSPFHPPTIIIDGLDECDGHDSQQSILDAIATAVFADQIHLRFLIASRPERQISQKFCSQPLAHHHHPITLTDDYQTCKELEEFLKSGFDKIYARHSDLMSTVERPWPSERDLLVLSYRASGQFLYASTVLRFVDSDETNPSQQLDLVLQRQPGSIAAFSAMDDLYTQILESCPDQQNLPCFLRSVFTIEQTDSSACPIWPIKPMLANHAIISGLQLDDVSVILRWLPAIIQVKRLQKQDLPNGYPLQECIRYHSPRLKIHHQSFIEFLADERRSGKFYINKNIAFREAIIQLDNLIFSCLSARERVPWQIPVSTWKFIQGQLRSDLESLGLSALFKNWRGLKAALDNIEEHWKSQPPHLSYEYFYALSAVCRAFELPSDKSNTVTETVVKTCRRIFDTVVVKLVTWPPTSPVWKLAGCLTLPYTMRPTLCNGWDSYERDHIFVGDCLSKLTGFTIGTIFQIAKNYGLSLEVDLDAEYEFYDLYVSMIPELKSFLATESRSPNLHISYRGSVISNLNNLFSVVLKDPDLKFKMYGARICAILDSFCGIGWDIRIDMDLHEGSNMNNLIDLIHALFMKDTKWVFGCKNRSHRRIIFKWSLKQLRIIEGKPQYATSALAWKLRDLIIGTKDVAVTSSFDDSSYHLGLSQDKLPPYSVQAVRHLRYRDSVSKIVFDMQILYAETTLLWTSADGIPAECHHAILEYHLFALLSSIVSRKAADLFGRMLDNVQWESHLSRARANGVIRYQLLTFHSLFTKESNVLWEDKTVAIERLPESLIRGGLAWLRRHYPQQGKTCEWYDRMLLAKG